MKKIFQIIAKFCIEWPGVYSIGIVLMMFFGYEILIRQIDQYAGTYDLGSLQSFLLAFFGLVFVNDSVLLGAKINFPFFYKSYRELLFDKTKQANFTTEYKIKMFLLVFGIYTFTYLFILYIVTSLTKTVYIPVE